MLKNAICFLLILGLASTLNAEENKNTETKKNEKPVATKSIWLQKSPLYHTLPTELATRSTISCGTEKVATATVLYDFEVGFDCLKKDILVENLKEYGIASYTRTLIRIFLAKSSYLVMVGTEMADGKQINNAIDQGRKLSCVLFLILVADTALVI